MRLLLAVLVLSTLGAPSDSQAVSVTGFVVAEASPPACAALATHRIRDTDVFLRSDVVDLDGLVHFNAVVNGLDISAGCPLIDVSSAVKESSIHQANLSLCGAPGLGCPVTLDFCPSPSSGTFLVGVADETGYLPISPAIGSLLLDLATFSVFGSGVHTAVCQSLSFNVPLVPTLIGEDVYFQALNVTGFASLRLTNVVRVVPEPTPFSCQTVFCY